MIPKLEELARELETLNQKDLATKARNDSYPRGELIKELIAAKLKLFAAKISSGYYDERYQEFTVWLKNLQNKNDTAKIQPTTETSKPETKG